MRKFYTAALILTFALVSLATAQPQTKHMRAEGEVIELMLLRQKSVREELKIEPAASKKIFEFTHKQQQAAADVHSLPEAKQKEKWTEMIKQNDEFLRTTLNSEQRKRLDQIAMHCAGLLVVTRTTIASELKLTSEQKTKAVKMQREAHDKVAEIIHAKSSEGRNEKLAEFRKTSDEQLVKLLTDEQQRKWKEMAGDAFKGKLVFEEIEKGK